MHFPVTVLGPGKRIGIWVQGCSIGCPGCISTDTWDSRAGEVLDINSVIDWCRSIAPQGCDGVTLSGGEPFQQSEALVPLLLALHEWRSQLTRPFDILCYSGYPLLRLERRFKQVLDLLDAVITEPFVRAMAPGKLWRGSTNQKLVPLTSLGIQRYAHLVDCVSEGLQMQFTLSTNEAWFIGIPAPGDFERMEKAVRNQGVVLEKTSWRA